MFRVEDLRDDVREPFIGMAVAAEFPCKCKVCVKGTQKLMEMGRELRTANRVHIVIKPFEKYERFQHAWYNESKLRWSALGAFVVSLNVNLGFVPDGKTPEEQWNSVKKFLEGKVFIWESVKPAEFVSKILDKPIPRNLPANLKDARDVWIPVRVVGEKELEKLGITEDLKTLRKKFLKEWKEELENIEESQIDIEDLQSGVDLKDIFEL